MLDPSAFIEGAICRPTKDRGRDIVTAGRPAGTDRGSGFLDNIAPLMVFVTLLKGPCVQDLCPGFGTNFGTGGLREVWVHDGGLLDVGG